MSVFLKNEHCIPSFPHFINAHIALVNSSHFSGLFTINFKNSYFLLCIFLYFRYIWF